MNYHPDIERVTLTYRGNYKNAKISEEVREWLEKIEQARDILRHRMYLSRNF